MYPKRLKIKVFLALGLILTIGMLLVDIVFVVFWQNDNQSFLMESAETEVGNWENKFKAKQGDGLPMVTSDLNELCQTIGPR